MTTNDHLEAAKTARREDRQKLLTEAAETASKIHNDREEAADMDARFDGGEISGPSHARMADKEIAELAERSGFTVNEIEAEMSRLAQADDGPH